MEEWGIQILKNYLMNFVSAILAALLSVAAFNASAQEPGELYLPSDDAMADLANAREAALQKGQRVLVVMGANWCHDSRALASRLYQEPLKSLIDEHYELVFVDVGYLDKGGEVISSIGPPVYYATPTVLIIDPASGRLVNDGNRHQWGNAYSINMEDSLQYFDQMAVLQTPAEPEGEELLLLLAEIDEFEQLQAQRLYLAYGVIGPMLRAYKEGDTPQNFEESWNEVRDFRMPLALDIEALRAEALTRVAAGETGIQLAYPEYPEFSALP
jgi:hypothetical protein